MQLNLANPLLFSTPNDYDCRQGLIFTAIFLIAGLVVYLLTLMLEWFPFFWAMAVLIGAHGYVTLRITNFNTMFLFRYFLIWALIGSAAVIWAIYQGEVKVAPFGPIYQDFDNTRVLVFAGFLSLCGTLLGWLIALRRLDQSMIPHFWSRPRYRSWLKTAGVSLAGMFSLLYFYVSGGMVRGGATYGQKHIETGVTFGVFNAFHFMGISFLILAVVINKKQRTLYLWFAISTLGIGMLAGSRADYLPQALILLLILYASSLSMAFRRSWSKRWLMLASLIGIVVIGLYLGKFIAAWRTTADIGLALSSAFALEDEGLIRSAGTYRVFDIETANHSLGTLYAAIANVRLGLTGLLWGESYWNWLLIAPPGFLGLPRPLGLEWSAFIEGQRMSQGGIFEVHEYTSGIVLSKSYPAIYNF